MCLILLASGAHPDFPLIVAANRDEAYERPAASADFWPDAPDIYGGRDLEQGGTWLGLSRRGRFAAITNFRAGEPRRSSTHSRGHITREYLAGDADAPSYLQNVERRADGYNGFSVIVGQPERLFFFSNRGAHIQPIGRGVHGLSNHLLDEPWPKVRYGTDVLRALLGASEETLVQSLFEVLSDRTPAPDGHLPSTGVPLQRERDLSPAFIPGEIYGTRASTVVLVSREGEVLFQERTYGARGEPLATSQRRFAIEAEAIRD